MLWEAYELHCIQDTSNKFYRIIKADATVVVRHGRRGAPNARLLTKQFTSRGGAEEYISDQHYQKTESHGYYGVFRDIERNLDHPAVTSRDPAAIEDLFLERWCVQITAAITTPAAPGSNWMVLDGLLSEERVDPSARFLLNAARATVHAVDYGRDLVLVPWSRVPIAASGSWDTVASLGVVHPDDTPEMAQAALALYQLDRPTADIMEAARYLVLAP